MQINWATFAQHNPTHVQKIWENFTSNGTVWSHIGRLSIDCQHNNYGSLINCSTVINSLTRGMEHLHVLRIVISEPDVFPLEIEAKRVDILEINFRVRPTWSN